MNSRIVIKILSRILFIQAAFVLSCIFVAFYFNESILPFVYSSIVPFLLGAFLLLFYTQPDIEYFIYKREAYFIVTFSWLLLGLMGSLPYLFSGAIPSVIDAVFESVSGFTTTGSSILTDIESLPKSILFWRSLTHWIGGIGIIVLVIAILPALQIGGNNLFVLESSLQDKIKPKIKSVGKRLLYIYLFLTFSEVALLYAGKMNLFESVCHAFGTVATGGFSPKNTSIAGYSPYIQYVIMVFMLLAAINFVMHYYFVKGDFKRIKENEELKFFLGLVLIIGSVITAALFFVMHKGLEESFREGFFQVISIISCTGFASTDYLKWPVFAWGIIFFAMFIGGSTGSTAGGVKVARHLLLFKNFQRIFRQIISPNAIITLRMNGKIVSDEANSNAMTFISVYLLTFIVGTIVLVFMGLDGGTAASSIATSLAGIGPGIGTVGPVSNFAHIPDAAKIVLSFVMLIGRLEIFTVIILFSPSFWKK